MKNCGSISLESALAASSIVDFMCGGVPHFRGKLKEKLNRFDWLMRVRKGQPPPPQLDVKIS